MMVFQALNGQENCFKSIFYNKPFLSIDTTVLVKYNVSKIKVYEAISDDTLPYKIEKGEWLLEIKEAKIISSEWKPKTVGSFMPCYDVYRQEKIKTGIKQFIKYSNGEVRSTHFINKFGRVYLTKIRMIKGGQYEDSNFQYEKIEYRYSGDFLIEAEYSTKRIVAGYNPFLRIYYEYYR
jgi:hypothetical protein